MNLFVMLGLLAVTIVLAGAWYAFGRSRRALPVFLPNATAAGEILDRHVRARTEVWVSGSEALAASASWSHHVTTWLKRGATINYLLVNPAPHVVSRVSELHHSGTGRLVLRTIDDRASLSDGGRATINKMKTFGFILGRHPEFALLQRQPLANGVGVDQCEVIAPAAGTDERYAPLKRILEDIWRIAVPVGPATPKARRGTQTEA